MKGGCRSGAGRKKLPEDEKVKYVSLHVRIDTKKELDKLQGDTYNDKIRFLIEKNI